MMAPGTSFNKSQEMNISNCDHGKLQFNVRHPKYPPDPKVASVSMLCVPQNSTILKGHGFELDIFSSNFVYFVIFNISNDYLNSLSNASTKFEMSLVECKARKRIYSSSFCKQSMTISVEQSFM